MITALEARNQIELSEFHREQKIIEEAITAAIKEERFYCSISFEPSVYSLQWLKEHGYKYEVSKSNSKAFVIHW